ncbi:Putative beta-barrel porin-2, OmpL-like. bbp2 [Dysgonomonas macrotermitis]|uniref:Putative beta-barrel porin-2, OmpL-like. bbp2 n=2 Tax=Dysgonomonas macrotermitis TaxID=1346286 RepID=A0A1M4U3A4_9BACT|nr:Putative beta-barrel porin-2, OmpL-like. bbp2 [Dysgonomonas macrotermitis]
MILHVLCKKYIIILEKMRLPYFFFVTVAFLFTAKRALAQDTTEFKPSGRIIARSFFDYSQGFGSVNNESGFDLTRAFLGYSYQISRTLQAQVIIDGASGKNADGKLEVYVRNAFIRWQDKGFDISVGEIGLLQFSLQENYWKHRYVEKSFQDRNKMAPSVDLGVTAQYKINDYLSADLSLTNGEGYKQVEKNNSTRYAAGLTVSPLKNMVFRVYGDIYNDGEDLRDALPEGVTDGKYSDQKSLALFAGYQNSIISGGAEFNKVFNKGFIQGKDYYGYSFYASGKIADKWRVYGRYDLMDSDKPESFGSEWNSLDGQFIIMGIEYQPLKQLKISPNFRNINPDRSKSEQYIFVNFEINL